MDHAATQPAHPELQRQLLQMQQVANSISSYVPYIPKPPVLDSSADIQGTSDEGAADPGELLPGLRPLLDAVRKDIDVTQKFLEKSNAASLPAPSTNATYLVAVWEEVLRAPQPIVAIGRTFFTKNEKGKSNVKKSGARPTPGVKVDVVADNGKTWIRVNTTRNSRLLSEFREIDSYNTDSEDGLDHGGRPSLMQSEVDNSILRMGRALISAAKDNPVVGTTVSPNIVFRLTRLDPHADPEVEGNDPRIALTIDMLHNMGIDVQLGERSADDVVRSSSEPSHSRAMHLEPTRHINLDLSILIALVSDLTHSSLPRSAAEAQERFVPSASYLEWKKSRLRAKIYGDRADAEVVTDGDQDLVTTENAEDLGKHSRALADQLQQEMSKGLLQEMFERLSTLADHGPVEFWTTAEARDRCIRIISKIGGPNEKRRAHALFAPLYELSDAEQAYWKDSRYPLRFLPLLPLHVFPSPEPPVHIPTAGGLTDQIPPHSDLSPFFVALERTSRALLGQETAPHPRALPDDLSASEIQRASVMKANPKLTAHTVRSMLWGAANGWTTLTANRASVKAIIREVRKAGEDVGHAREGGEGRSMVKKAAIWVVDPRSLAEGMRSDFEGRFSPGLSF
ncbi:hypothetical protein EWM64_g2915 [Hericium alpestre]|uniref:DUF1308 domain-containing protein n=1 Tax=Hericium alpestre TaxID=135208 RepID=A0A4Z0A227_9AGAM|nr:hypothetical protein EWM64_g2915 [Hericium alpestre]